MIIDTFLKYLQYEKNYSTHTVFAYKRDLFQFKQFVEDEASTFRVDHIDDTDIRRWLMHLMATGLSASSVNRKLSSLKAFFKYANAKSYISLNPAANISGPKKSKPLPYFVKEEEMDRLLDKVDFGTDFIGCRDRLMIDLLYSTGMRLSELQNLELSSFDLGAGIVKVTGKRNKQRIIPLHKEVISCYKAYLEKRSDLVTNQSKRLFVTLKGTEVYSKLIYRVVKKHLEAVTTISKKSPHVLRHTFATILLNKGADINVVKSLLGHANLSATEVYTHNTFEELTKIYKLAHPRA